MTNESSNDIRDENLRKALSALPRKIEPERDLWPGIAARIAPRQHYYRYWPAAAAIAVIAVGAIAAAILLNRPTANKAFVATRPQQQPIAVSMPHNARAQTLAASVRKATRLDPKTQAVLLRNLAIIENSLDNIERALNKNPDNPGLQTLLFQMYRNEAALLNAAQRVQLQSSTGVAL
ncbi:MAG: hypothetical protein ACRES9_00985 [Gammaproteobacteria bacterium]